LTHESVGQLVVEGGTVLTGRGWITDGVVIVEGTRIAAVGRKSELQTPTGADRLDLDGGFVAPGLIDLQVNGGFGFDLASDPGAIWSIGERLPAFGVTAWLPTIVSAPRGRTEDAAAVLVAGPPDGYIGAVPLGLHLEGPFIAPDARGAHDPAHLRLPDLTEASRWSPASGVRLVTLAPELPGAERLIATLAARGIVVSAGHSRATYDEARAGIEAGIRYGTHLFNAMPGLGHREPGLVGALLEDQRVTVGVIVDGAHLHPATVELVWRICGSERMSVVSDGVAAMGMAPGRFRLGESWLEHDGRTARRPDGRLAGSVTGLAAAVRNLVEEARCEPVDAIATVTAVPARVLGDSERGVIEAGRRADLVLLGPDLAVRRSVLAGRLADRNR
jgi:N-acetylglucosamine-6-phosphate deacetylase